MMLRSFLYAVRNRVEPVVDAYDSATLLAIPVLSEMSIELGSQPVAVPDFTGGRWLDREPQPASVFSLDTIHEECFAEGWTF